MLPLVIFVLALLVRMKPGQAALAALKVAVGFAGIFLVLDFFVASIGPAVQSLIARRGLDYPVLDVGWPLLAAITWASRIAPLSIPLGDLANLVSVLSVIVLAMRGNVFWAAQAGSRTSYAGPITAFTDGGNPIRFWFQPAP
jgi:galactitol-specific phosphotransferase system IIC component